jgi:Predicted AAA-ATPase
MHSFLQKVNSGIKDFLNIYATYFQPNDIAILSQEHTPSGVLIDFFDLVTMRGWLKDHKIDVMIDEYDQFTNQLLSYHSREFQKVVSEDDAVRVFYEVLKSISGSRK